MAEAISISRQEHFDLVLLDIALPDGSGVDVLQEIKSIDRELPVLIHSYHDSPELWRRSHQLGARGYLTKGVDKNELLHAVRQAASGRDTWSTEQLRHIQQVGKHRAACGMAPES